MVFTVVARVFRILFILIVAVGVVWATNLVNPEVEFFLPYVLVVLLAWEFTRVLAFRFRKRRRLERRRR